MIFGLRPVIEAIHAGKEIEKLLIQNGLQGELASELKTIARKKGLPFVFVPVEKLNGITRRNHQGVVCILSPIAYQPLDMLLPGLFEQGKIPFLMVLDHITDVRNMGAIARSAECAGAHAIILPSRGSAQLNADAIKTSAGALHKIPVCREDNLRRAIKFMKESGLRIFACTEKGELPYHKADFSMPAALVMGSEEKGISSDCLEMADSRIQIPLHGEIASLNVSVAAGIILFEAARQRN